MYNIYIINIIFILYFYVCFQVRDEYRKDFDQGRGGWGKLIIERGGNISFILYTFYCTFVMRFLFLLEGEKLDAK